MRYRIAIQPDKVVHRNGEVQSFSERWTELATMAGVEPRRVNVYSSGFLDELHDFDAFMWRFDYAAASRLFAKRLLPAIEHGRRIAVFPSWQTVWHFEDKIAQHYLMKAANIPEPRTWVFWNRKTALDFCATATYPFVMKLSYGFQSRNVRLIRSSEEANFWVDQLFGDGLTSLKKTSAKSLVQEALRRARSAGNRLFNERYYPELHECELQQGYFYVQEFLRDNDFDTRVTVIGNRAFAFRRFNRPGDFRASGSGRIDWDPAQIDLESVRLAFNVAAHLKTQSLGVDVLRRNEERVLNEISYTYATWAVRDCPGHWRLSGNCDRTNADPADMHWIPGKMRPEDAIFDDFLAKVKTKVDMSKDCLDSSHIS